MNEIPNSMLTEKLKKRLRKRTVHVDNCYLWTGQHQRGTGYMIIDGKQYSVSRLVYAFGKQIRSSAKVIHTCGNSLCSKPEHLKQELEDYDGWV